MIREGSGVEREGGEMGIEREIKMERQGERN